MSEPVFDPAPLRQLEAGAPGVAQQILRSFAHDVEALLADLERGEPLTIARTSHRIKGSSGSVGACALAAAAARLQTAIRADDAALLVPARTAVRLAAEEFLARYRRDPDLGLSTP